MRPLLRTTLLASTAAVLALPAGASGATTVEGCDPIDPAACLLPWPNDVFTKKDATSDTGRRLNLKVTATPRNVAGKPIDPTEFNRNDGFSPGSLIVTKVPGMESEAAMRVTGVPPITDVSQSLAKDQSILLIDAKTRKRQLIWAEVEYPDSLNKPASSNSLVIHPARNLLEGRRYIVALRDLRRADGSVIPANPAFRALRDGTTAPNADVESRRPALESIFSTLKKAKVDRDSLYLAWDFTVASERNLSERMLSIRDRAFRDLGDTNLKDLKVEGIAPTYTINPDLPDDLPSQVPGQARQQDGIVNYRPCSAGDPAKCETGESDRLVRIVRGRVLVPCFLSTPECATTGTFVYEKDGVPARIPGNMAAAPFTCIIPRAVLTRGPARPALYGHGLLGQGEQVTGGAAQDLANEQGILSCGTDWSGMSTEDLPNIVPLLGDLSRFASLADRGQQGMLNFMYLGRLQIHGDGFVKNPAFVVDGKKTIDTSRLYYTGGSQGGIMGGSLTAVAPDFTRAALGVPAMNYSILLQRSIDFDTYAQVMYNAYPNELERPIVLGMIQLLWDRAEANGYAQHMTDDPYPNTPAHEVILNMAYGDHQVTNWATIVMARTIGAQLRTPALEASRSQGPNEFFGVETITEFPGTGSLFGVWDIGPLRQENGRTKGTPPPPIGNIPNREGVDPHGPDASEVAAARAQVGAFLRPDAESRIIEACGDRPCYLDGWNGQ